MLLLHANNALNDGSEAGMAAGMRFEFAFAPRQRKKGLVLEVPSGLVVSSDNEVRRNLAEVLRQCALTPVLASTVAESGMALAGHEMSIVVCNDRLDDGQYQDIVKMVVRSEIEVPVIVVSRTGDWPEYLAAMCGGAFDYLAYPPIPGDLQQSIQNAVLRRHPHFQGNGEQTWTSAQ